MDTFESIITKFPKEFSVLDVGVGGVDGENTSVWLGNHFKAVEGITISKHKAEEWKARYPNYTVEVDNFYGRPFKEKYDLLVLDLTIESNITRDWNHEGLKRARNLIKDGGYLINYVMLTENYGNEWTKDLIKKHSQLFWGELSEEAVIRKLKIIKGFDIHHIEREKRRPEILWVVLKKTSGL